MRLAEVVERAFPPDWRRRHLTPEAALASALSRVGPEGRADALAEADGIATRGLCEMQLDALIAYELGSHLGPAEVGGTAIGWLAWLRGQLRIHIAQVGASGVPGIGDEDDG